MRAVKRYLAAGLSLILAAVFFCAPEKVSAEGEPEKLYAQSACLMDGASGRVLYGKDADQRLPMASTTKIMTCILVLENAELSGVTAASENAAAQPKVRLGVSKGEGFLIRDLLYSLMLESHNDSAVMLAEATAGSVEAFAKLMNEKAEELGCENTHFVTPNGLDESDGGGQHCTTARELARIMKYCIEESPKSAEFLEITRTPSYTFWNTAKTRVFDCANHNSFLNMMEGALSGKTGFTSKAGYCYVGALEKDGKTFIVALLACGWPNHRDYKWEDTTRLMNYALANYSYRDVSAEGESGREIPAADGQYEGVLGSGRCTVYCAAEENAPALTVLMRSDETVTTEFSAPEELKAPVQKGKVVGTKSYYLNGELIASCEIRAQESVRRIDFPWCLRRVMEELAPF